MRVGDRIIRKSSLEGGYILAARKQTSGAYMVCVRWDSSDTPQWLPSQEIRPWDKLQTPTTPKMTSLGRTTPQYLVALRRSLTRDQKTIHDRGRKRQEQQIADELVKLWGRGSKARNKSKKMIRRFESGA